MTEQIVLRGEGKGEGRTADRLLDERLASYTVGIDGVCVNQAGAGFGDVEQGVPYCRTGLPARLDRSLEGVGDAALSERVEFGMGVSAPVELLKENPECLPGDPDAPSLRT